MWCLLTMSSILLYGKEHQSSQLIPWSWEIQPDHACGSKIVSNGATRHHCHKYKQAALPQLKAYDVMHANIGS